MELRDQIARIIESSIRVRTKRINGVETALVDDLNLAADRILALPEIAEALARQSLTIREGWWSDGRTSDANARTLSVKDFGAKPNPPE